MANSGTTKVLSVEDLNGFISPNLSPTTASKYGIHRTFLVSAESTSDEDEIEFKRCGESANITRIVSTPAAVTSSRVLTRFFVDVESSNGDGDEVVFRNRPNHKFCS